MAAIIRAIQDFVADRAATCIAPIPPPGPGQRGPTCGFYALAYVMLYWHLRQTAFGGNFGLDKPLPARTNDRLAPVQPASQTQKRIKAESAKGGLYSSLRHYGKHNQLTAYGSVFNAENMVKVAHGASNGQYDGHVVDLSGAEDFVAKVKALIGIECPVIVPFDVSDDGEPIAQSGKAAHWSTIIATFASNGSEFAIHYHWGRFHFDGMWTFGHSNSQLTANAFLDFKKCEATRPDRPLIRDFMTDETIAALKKYKYTVKVLSGPVTNYEFCKPKSIEQLKALEELKKIPELDKALASDKLKLHGFDSMNLANAGLKDKIVAIYPAVEKDFVRSVA